MAEDALCELDPERDPRWRSFLDRSPLASVFHSPAWLAALRRTYGYRPVAFAASCGDEIQSALVFCRVSSPFTGRRSVSLPFADHCDPLLDSPAGEALLLSEVASILRREKLRYFEIRAAAALAALPGLHRSTRSYCFHQMDLRPDLAVLFSNLHKSSTQRKIQRAERERLHCESGRSPALFDAFWRLFLMTRRRHRVPPQPKSWFHNLIECFGPDLRIRVAFNGRQPVAAILTLRHKQTLVYKYGASDPRFTNVGGTQLLFWRSIQEAKAEGLQVFDLGRTDWDNTGLITFKDRWGATRSSLTYTRYSVSPPSIGWGSSNWVGRIARSGLSHLPDRLFSMVGRLLYRHMG